MQIKKEAQNNHDRGQQQAGELSRHISIKLFTAPSTSTREQHQLSDGQSTADSTGGPEVGALSEVVRGVGRDQEKAHSQNYWKDTRKGSTTFAAP